jgi:hypothetical protein
VSPEARGLFQSVLPERTLEFCPLHPQTKTPSSEQGEVRTEIRDRQQAIDRFASPVNNSNLTVDDCPEAVDDEKSLNDDSPEAIDAFATPVDASNLTVDD